MPGRLGVDFGTSNTVIALWDEVRQEGLPCHIPDYGYLYRQGKERISVIPSLINYPANGKQWVGNQVIQQNLQKSNNTFRWMKRYISNRSPVKRRLHGQQISYFDAGKDFLTGVLLLAAQINNINNEEVAFTVPVEAFEDYENWLAEVAKDAGMPRFRLLDEPSAAALGYGAQIQPGDVYLIFDFGGGTLDVAVVLIEEENLSANRCCRVLGKAGADLGGAKIDQWLFQEVLRQTGRNDTDEEVAQLSGALLVECEQAKISLSEKKRAYITLINPQTGAVLSAEFTRSEFEDILDAQEALSKIHRTIRRALNTARERGYTEDNIKSVLMVGGSSKIPVVQKTLRRIFGKERVMLDRPLDAVARGAAAFVAGVDFYDHIQHDYAVRYFNRQAGKRDYRTLVKGGTPYPTSEPLVSLTIKAAHDKQTHLGLSIFEMSTRHENSPNTGVELVFDPSGTARLNNLTPSEEEERNYFWLNEKNPTFLTAKPEPKEGEKCFQVQFSLNGNKQLLITARDLRTGKVIHRDYPVVKLT